jgi:GTP-binding protein HflX
MKKAILLSIIEDTGEMQSLLDTLGVQVIKVYHQNLNHPHKTSYLGPGKVEEIQEDLGEMEFDLAVVNGVLKPSQHHFLEMMFQKEFVDRPGVILRIFSDHAHTQEAIAQVTLAKLRYELPFLREWIHKSKSGDRPGFLAGGAYATDVYYEHAKTHARRIEEGLRDLSKQREITRTKRREKGYNLVSLAGYTNAGKSALMNRLCDSSVEVDNRLFSTLSTTTRRLKGTKTNILVSDTVGFIQNLPPDLIDAFNSTLEEMFYADLLLLVFDASESDEEIELKLKTSLGILLPKTEGRPLVVVGNKVDLIDSVRTDSVRTLVQRIVTPYELVFISALKGGGLEALRNRIVRIQNLSSLIETELPVKDESMSILSRLRAFCGVEEQVTGSGIKAFIKCRPEDVRKIIGMLEGASAQKTTVHTEAQGETHDSVPVEEKGSP